jgi:hypothetical protein
VSVAVEILVLDMKPSDLPIYDSSCGQSSVNDGVTARHYYYTVFIFIFFFFVKTYTIKKRVAKQQFSAMSADVKYIAVT